MACSTAQHRTALHSIAQHVHHLLQCRSLMLLHLPSRLSQHPLPLLAHLLQQLLMLLPHLLQSITLMSQLLLGFC